MQLLPKEKKTTCELCGGSLGPQKALVAFGCLGSATVLWCTPHFACDCENACIDAGDIWTNGKGDTPELGLWVWEGRIVYTETPNSPNGPAEFDIDYRGTWRVPTSEEWSAIQQNQNPWEPES